MSKLIFKSKFFITLALVFAMFAGSALPAYAGNVEYTVSMQPVECHGMYSDLNTKEQKKAYKAIVKKLKSGEYETDKKGCVFVYCGRLNESDVDELTSILYDEFFPATGGIEIWYNDKNCDDDELNLYLEPAAFKAFKENAKYIKKLQKKARKLCDESMTEKQASDTISKWIRKRLSYKRSEVGTTICAWWAYQNKKACCEGYSKLYKIMCNGVGIDCNLVVGYGNSEEHMWNRVNIDGKWYYTDLTWQDTGSKNKAYTRSLWASHRIDRNRYR